MSSRFLLILVACAVGVTARSIAVDDHADKQCSRREIMSQTNETILTLHRRAEAELATWPLTCIANGLETLDECLFPPPNVLIEIPCASDAVDQDDWAVVTNATTLSALVAEIDRVLESRVARGYPVDQAQALVEEIAWALPPTMGPALYSTRSTAGSCGPSGLELPAELVGSSINSCCAAHDSCYNTCGGFDQCNSVFEGCLSASCASLPWWALLRRWLCNKFRTAAVGAVEGPLGRGVYCLYNDNSALLCTKIDPASCSL